jgi:phosphate-selective porin OprO/OprP
VSSTLLIPALLTFAQVTASSTTTVTATETATPAAQIELVAATEKPAVKKEEKKPGFLITPAEGFTLRIRANLQADARSFFGDEDRRATDNFLLRRVRPSLEGRLWGFVGFRIMPDFGNGRVELFDAYGDLEFHSALKLRVGKQKENFGIERLQSQTDLVFAERSQANGLGPNRDIGAQIFGDVFNKALHYSIGVWNGVADGASGDLDGEDRKDYVGRVFVKPFRLTEIKFLHEVGFGIAGSHGIRRGRASAPGLPSYRTPGQQAAFTYDGDGTAPNTTFANGAIDRYSPQATIYLGPFGLMAEYTHTRQHVNKAGDQGALTFDAYAFTGSFIVTGENARYDQLVPEKPFDWSKGQFGALELAFRLDYASFSRAALGRFASAARNYSDVDAYWFGANWFLNENVKIVASFVLSKLDGNTTLPDSEKVGTLRFQFSY